MRAWVAWAFVSACATACSSRPPPPPDAGKPVVCCKPSPQPECCMQLGGAQIDGECPVLTCDIPDPATPGWEMAEDASGCALWHVPPGPFACGTPPVTPIEAAPPCAPVDTATYTPSPMTPPNAAQSVCTATELASFYSACIAADWSGTTCAAFQSSDASCAKCLLSRTSDPTWGPVVTSLGNTNINVAGCVALVQHDSSATSCAQRAKDALGCESFACDGVCPVTADAGLQAYETCAEEAAIAGCHSYVVAECDPADAGLDACMALPLDASKFAALAAVFCGGS